jgi:hypothetical protein
MHEFEMVPLSIGSQPCAAAKALHNEREQKHEAEPSHRRR